MTDQSDAAVPVVVTTMSEVATNFRDYNAAVARDELCAAIGYVRHWCAIKVMDEWRFGPSKLIGFTGATASAVGNDGRVIDGRMADAALSEWFVEIPRGHAMEAEVKTALRRFIASKNKRLHGLAAIHVLKREMPGVIPMRRRHTDESWRITSDAGKMGGKPLIRGLRIGVGDILGMMAAGAERENILEDYPYLENGDITAALDYAAANINS